MAAVLFKWLLAGMVSIMHPFYVGVTEINHNREDKTLEISVKLFIDDFETSLSKTSQSTVDLSTPRDAARTNQLAGAYLQQHLLLKVNGKTVKAQFLGYEKEREAVWCYLQVNDVSQVTKLEIDNTLLYDSYDKQIHIMHVNANGVRKSSKVAYPDSSAVFEL